MTIRATFAVLWVLIGMGAWTFVEWKAANEGTLVEFEIDGYDPRDLLAGHYVTYRINYGTAQICATETNQSKLTYYSKICACLNVDPLDSLSTVSSVESCDLHTKPSCPVWIMGSCLYANRFEAGIERFYIPESYSKYLMTIPENTRLIVNVTSDGRAMVKGLRIAGDTVEKYIEKQRLDQK
jgi:hypothetical protein